MKIHALITAAVSLLSLIGSLIAKLAAHDSLLLIALAALLVQWHAQRHRQARVKHKDARVTTMRGLSEDAALLSCSRLAIHHPELLRELHIFERAVVRGLADIHHGRDGAPPLSLIQRYVTVAVPSLLRTVQEYDDRLTLQSACLQLRQISQRLLPRAAYHASALDARFALGDEPSDTAPATAAPR